MSTQKTIEIGNKPWPSANKPASFDDITQPICDAIRFAYGNKRQNHDIDIPWRGLDIGKREKAIDLSPTERLTKENMAYRHDDQGETALETLIGLAVQLGIEQGRRLGREDTKSWRLMAKTLAQFVLEDCKDDKDNKEDNHVD